MAINNVSNNDFARGLLEERDEWADVQFVHEIRRRARVLRDHMSSGGEENSTLGAYDWEELLKLIVYLEGGADYLMNDVIRRENQRLGLRDAGNRESDRAVADEADPSSMAIERFQQMLEDYHFERRGKL